LSDTSNYLYRLAAQLARTEEAAKRALVWQDPKASKSLAKRVLELEKQLMLVTASQQAAEGTQNYSKLSSSQSSNI
jgi:hypothetical protein